MIFSVITSCEENTKNCNNCGSKNSIITRYGQFGKYYICSQCRVCITKEELEKYSQKKEEYYRQFCKEDTEKFHLVDGVCEFFDHLKEKDIPFTIASASIKENIDFFIESFGLDRWIKPEDIVYDDGTYENKIAMFHKAADVIGIDMKDIRIYEDSNSGIRNAYDAGCEQIVVICDKENEEEFLKRPGVIEVMQDFSFAKEL